MSYILDALNRSEQERQSQATPDLNAIHRGPPVKTSSSRWVVALVVLAVINTAGLSLFWLTRNSPEPIPVPPGPSVVQETRPASAQSTEPEIIKESMETTTPADQNMAVYSKQPGERIPTGILITPTGTSEIYADNQAVNVAELPENIRSKIPDLQFSSHLFSNESSFRMVTINGKMLREGEYVIGDLRLEEITEQGVVLNYLTYTFEVSVLRDWSFN